MAIKLDVEELKIEIQKLFSTKWDLSKFHGLSSMLGGLVSSKLEDEDGEWKQYLISTQSGYRIYVTATNNIIDCINIFDADEELVIGYQGDNFYVTE